MTYFKVLSIIEYKSVLNTIAISRVVRFHVRILFLSSVVLTVHVLGTCSPSYNEPLNMMIERRIMNSFVLVTFFF
jgi:hypothetical protein